MARDISSYGASTAGSTRKWRDRTTRLANWPLRMLNKRRLQQAREQLLDLDDHFLADLGLSRSELMAETRKSFWSWMLYVRRRSVAPKLDQMR